MLPAALVPLLFGKDISGIAEDYTYYLYLLVKLRPVAAASQILLLASTVCTGAEVQLNVEPLL